MWLPPVSRRLGFQHWPRLALPCLSLGKRRRAARDEALAHRVDCQLRTDLPVSADLEKGFGDAPEVVAERSGCSRGRRWDARSRRDWQPDSPLYDIGLARRSRSCAGARANFSFPFTLTARAHNLLYARRACDFTISALQASKKPGRRAFRARACLLTAVGASVRRLSKPVNFMWDQASHSL